MPRPPLLSCARLCVLSCALTCALTCVLFCACDSEGPGAVGPDAGDDAASDAPALPLGCDEAMPPATLACAGLYTDLASKQLAPGVEPFTPAVPLWSDGADKQRWISLPPGSIIDSSDPNEWVFPVGTRLWKEFSVAGRRIETRLWLKVRSNYWVHATYAWNEAETAAVRSAGGDVPLGAGTYHIPSKDECEKCHRGRTEHILGFEAVELGLPGAQGLTLAALVASGRLSVPPAATSLVIGDDGTGAAAPALGWLHANCGITCHNANSNAVAFPSGMRLRLDPALLDGRPVTDFDARRTTIGVQVNAPNWSGQTRIVPGDPAGSLLFHLIASRGEGNQMPPIASRLVDAQHVALVNDWIAHMAPPPPPPPDAAAPVDLASPPADVHDAGDAAADDTSDALEVPPEAEAADAGDDAAPAP